MMRRFVPLFLIALLPVGFLLGEKPAALKILFLGDNGHHRPAERFRQLQPVLAARGIDLTYTNKVESLHPKILASYDGIILFANIDSITAEQEKALLDFVAGG